MKFFKHLWPHLSFSPATVSKINGHRGNPGSGVQYSFLKEFSKSPPPHHSQAGTFRKKSHSLGVIKPAENISTEQPSRPWNEEFHQDDNNTFFVFWRRSPRVENSPWRGSFGPMLGPVCLWLCPAVPRKLSWHLSQHLFYELPRAPMMLSPPLTPAAFGW